MAQKDRIGQIEKMLLETRSISVPELSARFQVTEETIRRDIEKLENKGVATRTYGGAILNGDYLNRLSVQFHQRARIHEEEKRRIASNAVGLLSDEAVIGIDSSTTAAGIVRVLPADAGPTIVTNSVGALIEAAQSDRNVLSTGGFLNSRSMSLYGVAAQNTIQNYRLDVSFLGCSALTAGEGVFDSNEQEVLIKTAMIAQSQKVILVADHTKFDRISFVRIMGFESIDAVITDTKPDDSWIDFFRKRDIRLVY